MKQAFWFVLIVLLPTAAFADKSFIVTPDVPGCRSLTPAAIGGPLQPEGILAIR